MVCIYLFLSSLTFCFFPTVSFYIYMHISLLLDISLQAMSMLGLVVWTFVGNNCITSFHLSSSNLDVKAIRR